MTEKERRDSQVVKKREIMGLTLTPQPYTSGPCLSLLLTKNYSLGHQYKVMKENWPSEY